MAIKELAEARQQAYDRVIKDLRQCVKAIDAKATRNDGSQEIAAFAIALIESVINSYE